jgi:hypothetical protein
VQERREVSLQFCLHLILIQNFKREINKFNLWVRTLLFALHTAYYKLENLKPALVVRDLIKAFILKHLPS